MSMDSERLVRTNMNNPPKGRFDPARVGKHNPNDTEPRPVITAEDLEATRRLGIEEGWYKPKARG